MATKCIEMRGKNPKERYAQFWVNGIHYNAHRFFYEQKSGKIPDGMVIDHLCCNTHCINVDHMEVVTPAENTRRGKVAKLTKEKVLEIRDIYSKGETTQGFLAKMFKVGQDQISRIINSRRWKI